MEPIRPQGTASAPVPLNFDPICLGDAEQEAPVVVDWQWGGFLAAGEITLLTSQWKAGKTTLLSIFLAQLKCGGSLLGRPVLAGKAIVVSEEARLSWRQRHQRLDFGQSVRLMSRPFQGKPSFSEWEDLVDRLAALSVDHGYRIVVIDTLGNLFPRGVEHNADCMQRALASLRKLTDRGIAVWVLHHPRKGKALEGQLARGTSALSAYVDILLELHPLKNAAPDDRRRWLRGFSRHEETPRKLLIEWSADGTAYLLRNATVDEDFLRGWRPLRIVLEDADNKLRRVDILENWPPDFVAPSKATLWRWLDRAVDEGLVLREGEGRCNSPFRYYIAEKIVQWLDDPLQFIDEPDMYALAMKRVKARAAENAIKENHENTK
jgi:hypothetical protein